MKRHRPRRLLLAAALLAVPAIAEEPTLEQIMARDFVGTPPENPAWAADGRAIVYERRRPGTEIRDLYRVDPASGRTELVPDVERGRFSTTDATVESRDGRTVAWIRDGDLWVSGRRGRGRRQLTRTTEIEADPVPLLDGRRVAFRRGDAFFAFDLETGTLSTLAELRFADDPVERKPETTPFLEAQQKRLFSVLAEGESRRDQAREARRSRCAADPTCPPEPLYLGAGRALLASALSPDGARLALVVGPERDRSEEDEQGADGGRADRMARFVTASGYVEIEDVRPKVGTGKPESPVLLLVDLATGERREVDATGLPGLRTDPLAELRAANDPESVAGALPRVVSIETLNWSRDGRWLAVQYFSYDNKDRWIAAVDAASATLRPLERIHDPAWIGWRFNDLGWLRDDATLWYLSEQSGYSQLYLRPIEGEARQLTRGEFEIDAPRLAPDGRSLLVEANRDDPGIVEIHRVDLADGSMTRLTAFGGLASAIPSPDGKSLILTVSRIAEPPELYVQEARPGATPKKLTATTSDSFRGIEWTIPEIVDVPSSHGAGSIRGRLYKPADWSPEGRWPAVLFVHGAGYLQNAHLGWSGYSREFMFQTLLTRHGYVVLDLDYRASAGYGRDWRTAIYRQMGEPEVEDLEDGVSWLVAEQAVDRERVGVYGGSYGGFLTFMSMFRRPELFAAGAALRPVSDWAHYNHGYTSNILNTPQVDPEAYRRSSPIEYAEGLARPLLICHGMVDDNVVFQDTVRLVQRLVELGKGDLFEVAIFPVESHGFREPSSWVDEYRRIWSLFERTLGGSGV